MGDGDGEGGQETSKKGQFNSTSRGGRRATETWPEAAAPRIFRPAAIPDNSTAKLLPLHSCFPMELRACSTNNRPASWKAYFALASPICGEYVRRLVP
jgi:hypothetical protein